LESWAAIWFRSVDETNPEHEGSASFSRSGMPYWRRFSRALLTYVAPHSFYRSLAARRPQGLQAGSLIGA
jgi:ABC-type uncharacterized transport system permease subunit